MKKLLKIILLLLLSLLLCGCGAKQKDEAKIIVASDIHYIAPELIEDRGYFEELMLGADGKATQYIGEITDAFLAQAIDAKPDAVIISGDLTMNGAKLSHRELAEKLSALTEAGIRVLVIPGNHDITRAAYRFLSDGVEPAESVTPEEFREIYSDFGYSGAIAGDEKTLSYVAEINESLRILMLDVNTALKGSVPASTLKWTEKQLQEAKEAGCRVIAVSHQNLFIHDRLFNFGYQINNSDALAELYEKYGVELNLSGHLHIQHWTTEGSVTDIASSSLAVSPHQYGVLEAGDGMEYHTERTQVSVPGIEDFAAWSSAYFDISNSKFSDEIPDSFSPEEKEEMTAFAREMNRGLFSGCIAETDEELLAKWEQVPGFAYRYLSSMLPGVGTDFRVWSS